MKSQLKEKIKSGIPNADLVAFSIRNDSLKNLSNYFNFFDEDEFRHDGKMYDIVRKENSGSYTILYCLPDEKESRLFANLDKLVKNELGNNPLTKKSKINFQNFIGNLFFNSPEHPIYIQGASKELSSHYSFSTICWKKETASPPPLA